MGLFREAEVAFLVSVAGDLSAKSFMALPKGTLTPPRLSQNMPSEIVPPQQATRTFQQQRY